jgi:hypothetical protein
MVAERPGHHDPQPVLHDRTRAVNRPPSEEEGFSRRADTLSSHAVERELSERRYYRDPIVQSYRTQSMH